MCGIAGIIGRGHVAAAQLLPRLSAMTGVQKHRGPDGEGHWLCPVAPVALGHRRLAIVDLSTAGRQPMQSSSATLTMTFNGEVYNAPELRKILNHGRAHTWRGHSDTEVMVEAIEWWGLEKAVNCFNGMFAFALWSAAGRSVSLVRDRIGVKPLQVARSSDGAVIFGSETRSLAADPLFPAELNRAVLPSYLACGYLSLGQSIYRDALSLAPGSIVTFDADAVLIDWPAFMAAALGNPHGPFNLKGKGWHYRTYWSARKSLQVGRLQPYGGTFSDAVREGESLLSDAVQARMLADVPLGALLSGGVDSSLVVALMQRKSAKRVRTFSIGFNDAEFDESRHAEAVALHLGTEHTTHRVGRDAALMVATQLGSLLDEPMADSSFIPTYLVSELAKKHVTVAMTGDGGDEFFGGYWRYREFRRLRLAYTTPALFRSAVDCVARHLEIQLPTTRGARWAYYRFIRLLRMASQDDFAAAYRYAAAITFRGHRLLCDWKDNSVIEEQPFNDLRIDLAELMMHIDVLNVLPDDLLVKVDRASMAVSLECREPLLDYRIHDFAARLPLQFKLGRSAGKKLLRHVLYKHVPRELVDRPKKGFSVPLGHWLRHELKDCVEQTLFSGERSDTLFTLPTLREIWAKHQAGRWDYREVIWRVFVLKQWLAAHRWN